MDHDFQDLESLKVPANSQGIRIRNSFPAEARLLAQLSHREISQNTARPAVVRRVMDFSTELWFTFERLNPGDAVPTIVGYHAGLLLNPLGRACLLAGKFRYLDPDLAMLCAPDQSPSAILSWSTVASRGLNPIALPLVMEHLKRPRYRQLDCFGRGATKLGVRMMLRLGFVPVHPGEDPMAGCLMVYHRDRRAEAA